MSFERVAARGLSSMGRNFFNSRLNPSRWVEGLGAKMGIRMREKPTTTMLRQAVAGKQQVGLPERQSVNMETGQTTTLPATQDYQPAVEAVAGKPLTQDYAQRSLTGAGVFAQALPWLAGAGTLGYNMMKGDGTESATDANGVKNPAYNEEMAKFRAKFQQEKLGGDKLFSPAKYRALRKQNTWVDTAIQQIGKENYLKLKQQLADGKLDGGAAKMHSILTDAIAELEDDEIIKQAGTQAYVLPGLASKGDKKRVIVIAPMKSSKGKEIEMQALQYGIHEDQQGQK